MSPTKRLKCHSEPKRSGGEESKLLRRCAPQDNSIIELVAGSNKAVLGWAQDKLREAISPSPQEIASNPGPRNDNKKSIGANPGFVDG